MMLLPTIALAQSEKSEGFNISGEAKFKKTGDIFLKVMTEEQFKKCHDDSENESEDTSDTYHPVAMLAVKIGEKEMEQKSAFFKFMNIPPGTYAIQGFQDVNGNGILDEGSFGPKEPWGASSLVKRPQFRPPRFEEVKFELKQDITDMTIYIK